MPVMPGGSTPASLEPNDDEVFDPPAAPLAAPSPGPTASSIAPPDEEPHRGSGSYEESEEQSFKEFPDEYKREFDGLCFIGYLEDDWTWMGHHFRIRTLTVDEHLEIALLTARYQGSLGEAKAYQTATVAACIVAVDGKPLPIPITNHDSTVGVRFDWVRKNWHSITIDEVYEHFVKLDDQVHRIAEAMGKASGQTVSLTSGS